MGKYLNEIQKMWDDAMKSQAVNTQQQQTNPLENLRETLANRNNKNNGNKQIAGR